MGSDYLWNIPTENTMAGVFHSQPLLWILWMVKWGGSWECEGLYIVRKSWANLGGQALVCSADAVQP